MTHAQELREIADKADVGRIGPHNVADELRRIADDLEAFKAREPMTPLQASIIAAESSDELDAVRRTEAHHNITSKESV